MTRERRERELIDSGLVDAIKIQYRNTRHNIPDKYFILMADYIDSISQIGEDGLYLDPIALTKKLPNLLTSVTDSDLGGIYGKTNEDKIEMNYKNDYETNKLFFFHELTHAIQTRKVGNHEECSFYNGHTGMFLTEGATQFTAEILYNISRGENIHYRYQPYSVRGQSTHTPYSPLSQYQLNGNILMLLSSSFGVPVNQLLALGYRQDGRDQLKALYEAAPENKGQFESFMLDLEKIYSLDKLVLAGKIEQINKQPVTIIASDGTAFVGNMDIQNQLINKVERGLAANFIANNSPEYIGNNYLKIEQYLTTPELKQAFHKTADQVKDMNEPINSELAGGYNRALN